MLFPTRTFLASFKRKHRHSLWFLSPKRSNDFARYLEMQRLCTTATPVLFVILVLASRCSSQPCNENLRTRVEPWEKLENGSLLDVEQGDIYPEGTYWLDMDRNVAWACPCLLGACIRICSQGNFCDCFFFQCAILINSFSLYIILKLGN